MGRADHYVHGTNNAICAVCGFKWKANQLRLRWDGQWVCPKDWEPRHPLDFVRAKRDDQTPEVGRPEQEDVFIKANSVTPDDL